MAINVVILDDEPLAVKLLTQYVERTPALSLQLATTEPFKALAVVQESNIDLVLLDIQMPELTGLQFLRIVKDKCAVILTTAYPEYAVQGFELDVVDYLLKPITYDRFAQAIDKLMQRRNPSKVLSAKPHMFVRSAHKQLRINLEDIVYLESFRDYITIHTVDEKIMTLQSLRSFADTLVPPAFLRVHKSYLIATEKITAIEHNRILIGKTAIPIGDTYRNEVQQYLPIGK